MTIHTRGKIKQLKEKEALSRESLNKASDDVEKNALRILGLAALGGLASYVLYRVLRGSSEDEEIEETEPEKPKKKVQIKVNQTQPDKNKFIDSGKIVETALKAGIPLVIKVIQKYLESRVSDTSDSDRNA